MNNINSVPVIVTGSSGYLGSRLVDLLMETRHQGPIFCLDVHPPLKPVEAKKIKNLAYHNVDLHKKQKVDIVLSKIHSHIGRPAVVFHLAALFVKDFKLREQFNDRDYYNHNILATQNLLNRLQKNRMAQRVVFMSTAFVYKEAKGKQESVAPDNLDAYGQTKLKGEDLIKQLDIPWVILRSVRVLGLSKNIDTSSNTSKMKIFARRFLKELNYHCDKKSIPIDIITTFMRNALTSNGTLSIKPGNLERTYIHINDAVEAIKYTGFTDDLINQMVNLTTSAPVSLKAIGKIVKNALEKINIYVKLNIENSNEATRVFTEFTPNFNWKPKVDPSREVIKVATNQYITSIVKSL